MSVLTIRTDRPSVEDIMNTIAYALRDNKRPEITPAKVVKELSPVVNVPAPSFTSVPATPVSEAIVWEIPLASSFAPLAVRLTAVVVGSFAPVGSEVPIASCKVQALMIVAPL